MYLGKQYEELMSAATVHEKITRTNPLVTPQYYCILIVSYSTALVLVFSRPRMAHWQLHPLPTSTSTSTVCVILDRVHSDGRSYILSMHLNEHTCYSSTTYLCKIANQTARLWMIWTSYPELQMTIYFGADLIILDGFNTLYLTELQHL